MSTTFPLSPSDARIAVRQDLSEAKALVTTHTCHLQPIACFGDALTWRSAWCDGCDVHFVTARPVPAHGERCDDCLDEMELLAIEAALD